MDPMFLLFFPYSFQLLSDETKCQFQYVLSGIIQITLQVITCGWLLDDFTFSFQKAMTDCFQLKHLHKLHQTALLLLLSCSSWKWTICNVTHVFYLPPFFFFFFFYSSTINKWTMNKEHWKPVFNCLCFLVFKKRGCLELLHTSNNLHYMKVVLKVMSLILLC